MFLKLACLLLFVGVIMADLTLEQQWDNYKKQFGKSYSAEEDPERFELFKKSVKNVNDINKKYEEGTGTWKAEINKFADLKDEEKHKYQGFLGNKQGATGLA